MKYIAKGFIMIMVLIIMVCGVFGTVQAEQGDKVWSAAPPLATVELGTSGEGYVRGVAFPADSNSQFVINYIEAVTNGAGESWELWVYDRSVTSYQVTTLAFCGGNTDYVHAPNAMQSLADSGVSYFALDDGAGVVGFGMFKDAAGVGTGDILEVDSSVSSFAYGNGTGARDLSGVTFPAGSRVYPLTFRGQFVTVTADTIRVQSSDEGILAAPRGSPAVILNEDSTTGNTLFAVSGSYK